MTTSATDAIGFVSLADAENRPAPDVWRDCERFYDCLAEVRAKRLPLDRALSAVISDAKSPPGGQFFDLVHSYDPEAPAGKEFCAALAGFLASRHVPYLRRFNLACGGDILSPAAKRSPECQAALLKADLALIREAKGLEGRMPDVANLLTRIYQVHLRALPVVRILPPQAFPANPAPPRPLEPPLVKPMPAARRP